MPCAYFICAEGDPGYFKIGCTDNIKKRLASLQCGNRRKLSVYRSFECDDQFGTEAILHKHFKDHRVSGEWFYLTNDDVDYIEINDLLNDNAEENHSVDLEVIKIRRPKTRHEWNVVYELLIEYIAENHALPPMNTTFEYKTVRLGSWCNMQTVAYNKGLLAQERVIKLESIPCWKWSRPSSSAEDKIQILKEFMEINQRAPRIYESYQHVNIGRFVSTTRIKYKKGLLNNTVIDLLNNIPGWQWNDDPWVDHYNDLARFIQIHSRYPNEIEDVRLHTWVSSNKNKSLQVDNRIEMLEKLPNWQWSQRADGADWLKLLAQFYEDNKRLPLVDETLENYRVGQWLSNEKCKIRKGNDKYKLLQIYPNLLKSSWNYSFEVVEEWVNANNTLPAFNVEYKDIKIGIWIRNQRRDYKINNLTADKIAAMESLQNWYW